jgi:short-subunit dehydrogenase
MSTQLKAIVIGGSSGIGKALVQTLLSNNYKVGLTGIERDDLSSLVKEYPDSLTIKYIDCAIEDCSHKLQELSEILGGVDLIIFTAGIGKLKNSPGYKVENAANKVNVLGFTEIADWSYSYFEKRAKGHFVAITSIAGLIGFRTNAAYTACKGYQKNYMEALRQRAHKSKSAIYVTDIRCGYVDTEFSKDLNTFWIASPEKAARQIFCSIKRKRSLSYVSRRWRLLYQAG